MRPPPLAPRRPHTLAAHGDERHDDWYWLQDSTDAEVIDYLRAENDYTSDALAPLQDVRRALYEEIRGRVKESDVGAPARKGQWWYYGRTVEGRQYPIHCRRADPEQRLAAAEVLALEEQGAGAPGEHVLLDDNEMAAGSDYFSLGVFDISPDQTLLAYAVDLTGAERFALRFRDLATGVDLPDAIDDVYYSSAWSSDGQWLFYTRPDAALRPWQVWRHRLGTMAGDDTLVFQEDDERFFVGVGATRSERFIVISCDSKVTSEAHVIDARRATDAPRLIEARRQGVEYSVEHAVLPAEGDVFLILTNDDGAENFAIVRAPVDQPGRSNWQVMVAHRADVRLVGVDAFEGYVVVSERQRGLEYIRVLRLADGAEHVLDQPEPVYSLGVGANLEWATTTLRFGYTSLVTPPSSIEYDLETRQRSVVKQQTVLGGYDPERFQSERLWATASDGVLVPISLVYRRDLPRDGSNPCVQYGYGAYELSIDPTFSSARLSLLERGFVFAIAHIRGGGELGRRWYEDGKLRQKRNTFTDFITCAEHLIAEGYTSPERLVIRGGSAGGLLMGAVTNLRPDLWKAVVAEVPFVDVLTTMADASLPLTATEWEEWGNPIEDPEVYRYIKSYSPYDNVEARAYPSMYVSGGLNDPRVGFWEPAKWVAKQRAQRTDDNVLVLKTEMDAGHGGPSGRYDAWKDEAQVQSFILSAVGLAPPPATVAAAEGGGEGGPERRVESEVAPSAASAPSAPSAPETAASAPSAASAPAREGDQIEIASS
ncbi:MAG: oligopeptidase [Acidimicrobiaceae bacterium]|nr:oligopeptidase [Acidimicrobiaceae bacterium]